MMFRTNRGELKILVFPRDGNPYQKLLYAEVKRRGAKVLYLGRITPFNSLNLLLLPLELAIRRLCGGRAVHLHWVWGFSLPGAGRFPVSRFLAQEWFAFCLGLIHLLGLRLFWTAHNVLPHEPVFADDIAARRLLVKRCDAIFIHSRSTLASLADIGATPQRWAIIRHPPFDRHILATGMPTRRLEPGKTEFLFFGKILEYKGVEDLLQAFIRLSVNGQEAHLTIAGRCNDPVLRSAVEELAGAAGNRVSLRLQHIPDAEISSLMTAADVVVLPFRRVTTSGSAILALGCGKPIVIPNLMTLSDLPDAAVFRYDGTIEHLTAVLQNVINTNNETLMRMSAAALAYSSEATWAEAAATTLGEIGQVLRVGTDLS